ncbi:20849_t:CDS:2 [Entrophospora sp. SA101]|nr:20849_t:CDS:2 [Entrophospora sp. SA101]
MENEFYQDLAETYINEESNTNCESRNRKDDNDNDELISSDDETDIDGNCDYDHGEEPILPILSPDKKEIILVTHDECIFYSNDGKRGVWARDDNPDVPEKQKQF